MFRTMLFSIIGQVGNSCLEKYSSIFPIFHWIYDILLRGMVLRLPFASIIQFTGYLPFLEIQYSLMNGKSCLKLIKYLACLKGNMQSFKKTLFFLLKKNYLLTPLLPQGNRSNKCYRLCLGSIALIVYTYLVLRVVFNSKDALMLCVVYV